MTDSAPVESYPAHVAGRDAKLFNGIELPAWDADDLYYLFGRMQSDPTAAESDRYARQLMNLVGMRFRQKGYARTLPEIGVDPQDVAQVVVAHAVRKTVDGKLALRHEGPKVLLGALNTMLFRIVAGTARDAIHRPHPDLETDVWKGRTHVDLVFTAATEVTVAGVLDALLTPEAVARAIRGTAGPRGEGARATALMWRLLVRNLRRDGAIWPHAWLPRPLRDRTSPTLHALLCGRLQDSVAQRAALVAA